MERGKCQGNGMLGGSIVTPARVGVRGLRSARSVAGYGGWIPVFTGMTGARGNGGGGWNGRGWTLDWLLTGKPARAREKSPLSPFSERGSAVAGDTLAAPYRRQGLLIVSTANQYGAGQVHNRLRKSGSAMAARVIRLSAQLSEPGFTGFRDSDDFQSYKSRNQRNRSSDGQRTIERPRSGGGHT